jgi:hypothetical protein
MPNPWTGAWPGASPQAFKPIVRLGSVAYRVTRLEPGTYEIVRIVDDRRMGTFRSVPTFQVTSSEIHPAFVRKIAALAAKAARPSFAERIASAWRGR